LDEDADMGRLYLPDEILADAGIMTRDPHAAISTPRVQPVCVELAARADSHFRKADRIMAAKPKGLLGAPRLMEAAYSDLLKRMLARGWAPPRNRLRVRKTALVWPLLRQGLFG
jgi:phytoene synthase